MPESDKQRLLLGWDIGGTKTVGVVARDTGEILAESRLEEWASGDWSTDLDTLVEQAHALLQSAGAGPESLSALGVSAPGPLSLATGRVIEAPNLAGWADVPVVEQLSRRLGAPVRLENDANAAALAEWRFGAGQGCRNLIYLTLSTGLGAGLILDGKLYRGTSDQAGEVGHIPVVSGGRTCHCGLSGCLEAYVGGAALADIMREDLARGEQTSILERAGGDPAHVSARLWVEALREGDPYAARLREDFLDHLAQGLAILVHSFDPELIVLGTIVQKNPDLFLDDLIPRVRARTWSSMHHTGLVAGELGERLPAYAALCVASFEPPAGPLPKPPEPPGL